VWKHPICRRPTSWRANGRSALGYAASIQTSDRVPRSRRTKIAAQSRRNFGRIAAYHSYTHRQQALPTTAADYGVSDVQLRGKILQVLYDRRNNADGWVPISDIDVAGGPPVSLGEISSVCRQLSDANLMRWKPLVGGGIAGVGQITGQGLDVVETGSSSTLRIEFSRSPTLHGVQGEGRAGYFYDVPAFAGASGKGRAGGEVPLPSQAVDALGSVARFSSGGLQAPDAQDVISLRPTAYPHDPAAPVTVRNFVTVNVRGPDFLALSESMDRLIMELRQSNVIAGEVRDKLIAEMEAGLKVLASPKPDPKVIDVFLVRPLKYIGDKAAGPVIAALALAALAAIGRMTGMF